MRPQNSVRDSGYLTPDSVPDERICRSFSIPNDAAWLGVFMGALVPLLQESAWRQFGTMTPDECAAVWQDIFFSFEEAACAPDVETPYWDDETDVGESAAADVQTWYGQVSDVLAPPDGLDFAENAAIWIFAGFLATSGDIGATIAFLTIAPKFVLAWKRGDVAELFRIVVDSADVTTIDTSSYSVGDVITLNVIGDPDLDTHQIYIIKQE